MALFRNGDCVGQHTTKWVKPLCPEAAREGHRWKRSRNPLYKISGAPHIFMLYQGKLWFQVRSIDQLPHPSSHLRACIWTRFRYDRYIDDFASPNHTSNNSSQPAFGRFFVYCAKSSCRSSYRKVSPNFVQQREQHIHFIRTIWCKGWTALRGNLQNVTSDLPNMLSDSLEAPVLYDTISCHVRSTNLPPTAAEPFSTMITSASELSKLVWTFQQPSKNRAFSKNLTQMWHSVRKSRKDMTYLGEKNIQGS